MLLLVRDNYLGVPEEDDIWKSSGMASPAKVQKDGEDRSEGFIHDVSPRKQSRNSSSFFTAVLQSGRQEYHRVVIFAMEKQSTFSQAANNGNAVKLLNVRRNLSYSDPDVYDVLCSRATKVEVTRLPFLRHMQPGCKTMSVAEVKALGPKQKVGEVRGKVRVHGFLSRMVTVKGSDVELKEVVICDGTGEISVTLWDSYVNQAEGGNSYAFKNLSTRERDGNIRLCTGPASTIEQIPDLEVPYGEGGEEEDGSKALFSATLKGIDATIQRKCSSCQFKQTAFLEKSMTHRCERCNLKQASLAFSTCFGGKATFSTADGNERVLLTSSALTSYLRAAGLSSAFNDAETIADHFLQSAVFDVKVNVDGFLVSIEAVDVRSASGADDPLAGDRDEGASQVAEQVNPQLAEEGGAATPASVA